MRTRRRRLRPAGPTGAFAPSGPARADSVCGVLEWSGWRADSRRARRSCVAAATRGSREYSSSACRPPSASQTFPRPPRAPRPLENLVRNSSHRGPPGDNRCSAPGRAVGSAGLRPLVPPHTVTTIPKMLHTPNARRGPALLGVLLGITLLAFPPLAASTNTNVTYQGSNYGAPGPRAYGRTGTSVRPGAPARRSARRHQNTEPCC